MTSDWVEVPAVSIAVRGFDVIEAIGSGGFSRVYRATQPDLGRDVALKVLRLDMETRAQRTAFERECRAMGALAHHPSIVSVFASTFAEDGRPCIVMEYFESGTFGDRLKREGKLEIASLLRAGVEVAGALQTAHDHGVVHRDIKPSNLFVSAFGTAVLGDFGISSFDDERTITGGGGLTVHYAPPELIEGEPASAASDIYSLAASLFTLAAGDKPYLKGPGQTTADLARRILVEPTPRLAVAAAPASLADLLWESMTKEPDRRPASAGAFGLRLQEIQAELGLAITPLIAEGFHETGPRATGAPAFAGAAATDESRHREGARPQPRSVNRRLTAAALGGVALVALGSGAVAVNAAGGDKAAGGDREATSGSSPSSPSTTADPFFALPSAPSAVSITSDHEGSVTVSWSTDPSGTSIGYQVQQVGSAEVIETSIAQAIIEVRSGAASCFVVRAVGHGGRLSDDADPVCLGDG